MLRESFHALKRKAAPGIDGVTHAMYAEDLEGNLAALEKRLKEGRLGLRQAAHQQAKVPGEPSGAPGMAAKGALRQVGRPAGGAARKLQGYWNYYGVIGNSMMTARYQREAMRLLYKWLNRRSQRRSMTWRQFSGSASALQAAAKSV